MPRTACKVHYPAFSLIVCGGVAEKRPFTDGSLRLMSTPERLKIHFRGEGQAWTVGFSGEATIYLK